MSTTKIYPAGTIVKFRAQNGHKQFIGESLTGVITEVFKPNWRGEIYYQIQIKSKTNPLNHKRYIRAADEFTICQK